MVLTAKRNYRNRVQESMERDLFGLAECEFETVRDQIFNRYLSGMLFLINSKSFDLSESDEPDADVAVSENRSSILSMTNESLPASMGISFLVKNSPGLTVLVEWVRYKREPEEKHVNLVRKPLAGRDDPLSVAIGVPEKGWEFENKWDIFNGLVKIHAYFRPREDGHLVTVSMINSQTTRNGRHSSEYAETTLFQCRFRVRIEDGMIGVYPTGTRLSLHEED